MGDPEKTSGEEPTDPARSAQLAEIARIHMNVYGRIGAYLLKNAPTVEVAQELTQKAGEQLWTRWTRDPAAFAAPPEPQYLAERVARNLLIKQRRDEERWAELIEDVEDLDELEADRAGDYLDDAVFEELQDRVDLLVEKMPPRMRAVWELSIGGYEVPEIAAELGIEESTVRSHLSNAAKRLGGSLKPYLEEGR